MSKFPELPDESWFSEIVCEARNRYSEAARGLDLEFDYPDGMHPDDWIGKFIREEILKQWRKENGNAD